MFETKPVEIAMCLEPQAPRIMPIEMQHLENILLAANNSYDTLYFSPCGLDHVRLLEEETYIG